MAKLKILHPRGHTTEARSLPNVFVVAGTVRSKDASGAGARKIRRVEATVRHIMAGGGVGQPIEVEQRMLRLAPAGGNGRRLRWAILVKLKTPSSMPVRSRLTVIGYDVAGAVPQFEDEFDGWIGRVPTARLVPSVDMPWNGYPIQGDERLYFIAYGGSELPMVAVTIGGRSFDHMEWYGSPDNFWWAEFIGLGADPGTDTGLTFMAENTDGSNNSNTVDVSNS
jgi:hypothetical protein